MKYIKLLYKIGDDIYYNCLNKCPFDIDNRMCGSYACHKCEHCIGSGNMPIWDLSVSKGINFNQGYVICKKAYNEYTLRMRVMKLIHKFKMK